MKLKKLILLFVSIMLNLCSCDNHDKSIYQNNLKLIVTRDKEQDSNNLFHIKCSLINKSTENIYFIIMVCGYEELFVSDNSNFQVVQDLNCYSNKAYVESLPPQHNMTKFLKLKSNQQNFNQRRCRIGMYIISPSWHARMGNSDSIYSNYDGFIRNKQTSKIIWSEPIEI